MTIYRHSEFDFDLKRGRGNRYFDYDEGRVDRTRSCDCGQSCGGSCSSGYGKSGYDNGPSSSESNFFNSNDSAFELQEGTQLSLLDQESAELIWVKESCNITVHSTDTQIGVSLQAALQFAIALVLNISIADGARRDAVSQELIQQLDMGQRNKQKIFVYNTKDAVITTKDTDLAINIQLMLQVLVALMLLIDIL